MPPDAVSERLASIAKVADDLDSVLDQSLRNAADLKKILERAQPGENQREAP